MADRCPVCFADDWGIDYVRTGDGEMPVPECQMCGWPGPGPRSVAEARAQWLDLGATPFSHPSPDKLRHIGTLLALLDPKNSEGAVT